MKQKIIFYLIVFLSFFCTLNAKEIRWQYDLEDAKELALHFKKPIFLFLESRKCYYCPIMKEKTFRDKKIINKLSTNFIPLILDNSLDAESDVENTGHAPERLTTSMTPAIYIMGPKEEMLARKGKKHLIIYGMWDSKDLLEWLDDGIRKFKKLYGENYE